MNLRAIPAMLSMLPSVARGIRLSDLQKIKHITRLAFPSVRHINPQTLADWLASAGPSLLLIDVRTPAEFAVSHLPGAINAPTVAEITPTIAETRPAKTVLYCSVGFRSSQIANRLQTPTAIFNLEGSIFEWANQGLPLFQGTTAVRRVHPFARRWAGLLLPGLPHLP
jgi:rhodanese-related sulfurtransferase